MSGNVVAVLAAILGGGGFFGFITFLITRMDNKRNKNSEIIEALQGFSERLDRVEGKLDLQDAKADERNAVTCRVRILRFYDEMRSGIRHTKDSWDQCLSDTSIYDQYCSDHPEFKNNQTKATVAYIMEEYHERLVKNDFA